jgi:hypothetical protein
VQEVQEAGPRPSIEAPDQSAEPASSVSPLAELARQVDRHPYGTVAAALGIGYALGGGLFTPLTSRLLRFGVRIGIRAALLPVLKTELSELAAAFVDGTGGMADENEQGEPT